MGITEKDIKNIIECYLEVTKQNNHTKRKKNSKPKQCKPDQILNPNTNRCVKKDTQLGKKILNSINSMSLKNRLKLKIN